MPLFAQRLNCTTHTHSFIQRPAAPVGASDMKRFHSDAYIDFLSEVTPENENAYEKQIKKRGLKEILFFVSDGCVRSQIMWHLFRHKASVQFSMGCLNIARPTLLDLLLEQANSTKSERRSL